MKNRKTFLFGLFTLVLIFALAFTTCNNGTTGGGGGGNNVGGGGEPGGNTEHTHNWGRWAVTTAATCTTDGVETRVCSLDASHKETRTDAALGHLWGEWLQAKAPTETLEGEETRTCTHNSSHKETRPVALLNHTHIWSGWTTATPATCVAAGEEKRICTVNTAHYETRPTTINPAAHIWGAYTVTAPATCTTAGVETRTCTHDHSHAETQAIAALGHNWSSWIETISFIEPCANIRTCANNSAHTEKNETGPARQITNTSDWNTALSQLNGKIGNYTLTVNAISNIGVAGSTANSFGSTASGSLSVTLKGTGKLKLTSPGNLLRIAERQTLVIDSENLIFEGLASNNNTLVYVNSGTLELKNGTIAGNISTNSGGGVYVASGTFTMDGGVISGNTGSGGGGVFIMNGTFTMDDGKISDNTSTSSVGGGGVFMYRNTTFIMNDGIISGNTCTDNGGGVRTAGTFYMYGGIISGNTVRASLVTPYGGGGVAVGYSGSFYMYGGVISSNIAYSHLYYEKDANGGGVFIMDGTFVKSGGTIYGYTAGDNNSNVTMDRVGDVVLYRYGHAVYVYNSTTFSIQWRRESTAGPSVNLDSRREGTAGGWEN